MHPAGRALSSPPGFTRAMRGLLLSAAVIGSTVVFAPASASAATAGNCAPKGSRTVAANESVRVYRHRDAVYACHLRRKRPIRLGPAGPYEIGSSGYFVDLVRVSGNLVGYAINWQSPSSGGPFRNGQVRLVSAATRRFLHRGGCPPATIPDAGSGAVELVLVPQGRYGWGSAPGMGWICSTSTASGPSNSVHKFDRTGAVPVETSPQVLFGLAVSYPNSQSGAGPTLYWRKSGSNEPQSVEFGR